MSDLKKLRELAEKVIESKPTGTGSEWRIHYDYEKATSPETVIALIDRIEKLEAQLEEANAVAEFYGDESNWEETWCDFGDDGRDGDVPARIDFEDCEVCEDEFGMYLGSAGKRARAYLKKWEGK